MVHLAGIGWKSWKKRWFILTRTSLVFFKNDPSALPQRGGEVNLTLGGIDLNNSGSVVVREDKKLLTVLFPDGRDGRAFTLKAETLEDLYEWKTALEQALAQAPSAALVMGHNGIFRSDATDSMEGSFHQWRDKRPVKSLVVGRPILLALEDIDGGPSFLEKALQFLEKYGIKVEGILRQSADVEEVDRRVQEYEQGKNEFTSDEDAHVVGDCVKHVLRELPSSPVPASCCTALLEAYRFYIAYLEPPLEGLPSSEPLGLIVGIVAVGASCRYRCRWLLTSEDDDDGDFQSLFTVGHQLLTVFSILLGLFGGTFRSVLGSLGTWGLSILSPVLWGCCLPFFLLFITFGGGRWLYQYCLARGRLSGNMVGA
ncbi:rho GTPase-activating protein 7-like isoform X2 [Senna tora]|uniref:Rho GTPase-activating protein 7-like isoform X2 n=1 Tax=Senna tora TaxID=362788 RepID=A0A835C5R7_9FABA|nr:rho GTPase-activating protein 7-like isoform X2 [Senna tora]